MTIPYTKLPVIVFISLRNVSPSVEKWAIIAVCNPNTDIIADTKFKIFAADKIGLPSLRYLNKK